MEKLIENVELKVTDIEAFQDLIDVMSRHADALPVEGMDALQAFCDDAVVYDIEHLAKRGIHPSDAETYVDGKKKVAVVSGHPVGRRVVGLGEPDAVAGSFWIVANGKFICGWGEKPEIEVAA